MYLTRCQDQKNQTLDEFYSHLARRYPLTRESSEVMLSLIARLRALPDERRAFGLTSLSRLCLLAQDSWQSPWFVIISAKDTRNYYVEYLIPERLAPQPRTYVHGAASSEDDAVRLIATAMEKSEGWMQTAGDFDD